MMATDITDVRKQKLQTQMNTKTNLVPTGQL